MCESARYLNESISSRRGRPRRREGEREKKENKREEILGNYILHVRNT